MRYWVAIGLLVGGATIADGAQAQRVLGKAIIACKRVETSGTGTNEYYATLDVRGGMLNVSTSSLAKDANGKLYVVPSGSSSGYSKLLPLSRTLATGITEAQNFSSTDGFVLTQSSSAGDANHAGYVSTSIYGAISIPGVVRDENKVGLRVLKDGREVWRWDEKRDVIGINDVDAPKVYFSPSFSKGQEQVWLNGRIVVEASYKGKTVASYVFDSSLLRAKAMLEKTDPQIIGTKYQPGALPRGCVVKPIEK